jgi:peptidoglycan/LPS O-acetylase OafA/YrhL
LGQATKDGYEPHIDGLRGAMAMWVFIFHASVVTGFVSRLIPSGGIAVDIFMFISGLLMTRNFLARENREPLASPHTRIAFLIRRFFRIAPLYYPLFFVGVANWSNYMQTLNDALTAFPPSWAALLPNDPSQHEPTLVGIVAHLTFLFGLFPQFASNDALPDWSLSLEMQFYVALPLILLAARRVGLAWIVLVLMVVQALSIRLIGFALVPGKLGLWPQPSLLPLKINCFMTGVAMAFYFFRPSTTYLALTLILIFWGENDIFSVIALFCFLGMLAPDDIPFAPLVGFVKRTMSGRFYKPLGDISYGIYLIHMLVLLPVSHLLMMDERLKSQVPSLRFLAVFLVSAIIVIPLAHLAHIAIEKPGIKIGHAIARRWTATRQARPSAY